MSTLKRNDIKFCPLCGTGTAKVSKGEYAHCEACDFRFKVSRYDEPRKPQPNGDAVRRECGDKIRHQTLVEAVERGEKLPDIPNRYRDNMVFYLCRFCACWHIGHEGKRQGKAKVYYTYADIRAGVGTSGFEK